MSAHSLALYSPAVNSGAKAAYVKPGLYVSFMYSDGPRVHLSTHSSQNHSEYMLGTENTPQCRKIPTFASSYQDGNGRESKDSQFGSYRVELHFDKTALFNINETIKKYIL